MGGTRFRTGLKLGEAICTQYIRQGRACGILEVRAVNGAAKDPGKCGRFPVQAVGTLRA